MTYILRAFPPKYSIKSAFDSFALIRSREPRAGPATFREIPHYAFIFVENAGDVPIGKRYGW